MKLSEVLRDATTALRIRFADEEAIALRVITPALVELVAADHDFETADKMDELQAANQRLIDASRTLRDAMKEAGVSCD